jgi:uncharacterized protein (TIGR02145 family)
MNKSILKKIPALLVILVVAGGVQTFTSCSSDDGGGSSVTYGSVTYQGQTYKTVKIGNQTWFAENLNYAVEGSKCYVDDPTNCAKYGRLYNWKMAMTVCPSGWHLPSDEEWEILVNYAGGEEDAGTKLKAKNDWGEYFSGTDDYGFSALKGGYHDGSGFFVGFSDGYWWSATEGDNNRAYYRRIPYYPSLVLRNSFYDKNYMFSVRFVKD